MRIVVDANVLMSAFLRDGATRWILFHQEHDFLAPKALWQEFQNHRADLLARTTASKQVVEQLETSLRRAIVLLPDTVVRSRLPEARALVRTIDPDDAPYVAAALATDAVLWTHDRRLAAVPMETVTTAELMRMAG